MCPSEPKVPSESDEDEPADYPRPAPPGTGEPHQHNQHDEEQPKRDKKQLLEHERRIQEELQRKAELNRPSKDIPKTKPAAGAAGRISQPQSKVFAI